MFLSIFIIGRRKIINNKQKKNEKIGKRSLELLPPACVSSVPKKKRKENVFRFHPRFSTRSAPTAPTDTQTAGDGCVSLQYLY